MKTTQYDKNDTDMSTGMGKNGQKLGVVKSNGDSRHNLRCKFCTALNQQITGGLCPPCRKFAMLL